LCCGSRTRLGGNADQAAGLEDTGAVELRDLVKEPADAALVDRSGGIARDECLDLLLALTRFC
jgi:hypothetical protein